MDKKTSKLITEIIKISKKNSQIQTVIIFGSVARNQAGKQSDLDICMILKNKTLKNSISNQMLNLEEKYDKNINLIFTNSSYKNLDRQFIETLIREGIVIYGKKPDVSIKQLKLEPYEIIKYDLSKLNQSKKMKIKRLLYGIKTKKRYKGKIYERKQIGLVEKFGGIRIGIASILIPEKMSWDVEKILRDQGVYLRKITIWLSKP
jgi:predicted nucleotidyltransferase